MTEPTPTPVPDETTPAKAVVATIMTLITTVIGFGSSTGWDYRAMAAAILTSLLTGAGVYQTRNKPKATR